MRMSARFLPRRCSGIRLILRTAACLALGAGAARRPQAAQTRAEESPEPLPEPTTAEDEGTGEAEASTRSRVPTRAGTPATRRYPQPGAGFGRGQPEPGDRSQRGARRQPPFPTGGSPSTVCIVSSTPTGPCGGPHGAHTLSRELFWSSAWTHRLLGPLPHGGGGIRIYVGPIVGTGYNSPPWTRSLKRHGTRGSCTSEVKRARCSTRRGVPS